MFINLFETFFKKPENQDLIDSYTRKKLEAYCYGVDAGQKLRRHLEETGAKRFPLKPISSKSKTSFCLGFKKGLYDPVFLPKFEAKKRNETVTVPFTVNLNPKDFNKKQFNETQIYLRHS